MNYVKENILFRIKQQEREALKEKQESTDTETTESRLPSSISFLGQTFDSVREDKTAAAFRKEIKGF